MKSKMLSLFLCAAILSANIISTTSYANSDNTNLVTINTKHDGTTVALYTIADNQGNLTAAFDDGSFDVSQIGYDLTKKLIAYIETNNVQPDRTVKSENAAAKFTSLSDGIYLIDSESYVYKNVQYEMVPFTIKVEDDISLNAKYDQTPVEPGDNNNNNPGNNNGTENGNTETPEPNPEPGENPDIDPKPTPEPDPNETTDTTPETTPNPKPEEHLPQTGQNWLAAIGTGLIGIGLLAKSRKPHKP